MSFLRNLRIDPGPRETDVDEDTDDFSGGGEDRVALRLLDLFEEAWTETLRPEIAVKLRRVRNCAEVARVPTVHGMKPNKSRMRLPQSAVLSLEEQVRSLFESLNTSE
jgi:hypothetical protein